VTIFVEMKGVWEGEGIEHFSLLTAI
jgi:hypothetical protein